MIEINLLPHELRQPEGTPLPRLLTAMGGVILAVLAGVVAAKFHLKDIPETREKIALQTAERDRLQKQVEQVNAIRNEINSINERVNALRNLANSQILWSRMLDYWAKAVPNNCVIGRFTIRKDAGTGGGGPMGTRFVTEISGFSVADTDTECDNQFRKFMNNIRSEFKTNIDQPGPPAAPDPNAPQLKPGQLPKEYHEVLKLKFMDPEIRNLAPGSSPKVWTMPASAADGYELTEEQVAKLPPVPKRQLKFEIAIPFYMPPPLQ
ncbi:MAG: DUF4407 domain-containing protein [Planctomycetes bacterium]|nr:DUF4407 domain-containing protein [Planctomycetota bacterium]